MEALPATLWKSITPELYIAFWTFSLRDVFMPKDEYAKQILRLKGEITGQDTALRVVRALGSLLCVARGPRVPLPLQLPIACQMQILFPIR